MEYKPNYGEIRENFFKIMTCNVLDTFVIQLQRRGIEPAYWFIRYYTDEEETIRVYLGKYIVQRRVESWEKSFVESCVLTKDLYIKILEDE